MLRLLLLTLLVPAAAGAAPQHGCPPLGALPDFVAQDSVLRAYDTMEMEHKGAAGDPEPFLAAGRTCVTDYTLREGKDAPSNLEIQMNYREQLA